MRTRRTSTATAFGLAAALALAGCGSDGADTADTADTTPATTPVSTTSSPTTAPPTVPATVATTTTVAPTTAAPTTVAFSGPGAPDQLAAFLTSYDVMTEQLPVLLDDLTAEIDATGEVSTDSMDRADDAGGDVIDITRLVPVGLDPTVRQAVHDAVMMVAAASSAYLYAPGWSVEDWADWRAGMSAAQDQLGAMRAIVAQAAAGAPQMTAVAPGSREEAEGAMLSLEIGRRFGHGGPGAEIDAALPVVHWVGSLRRADVDGTQCYVDDAGAFSPVSGDFVDGVGGCAVVFYDGIDHPDEIDAWRSSGGEQFPSGEFVAFVFTGGAWQAGGSVE